MSAGLLILSGPSCVGKGPLLAALARCRPDLPFAQPVVYTSRPPRPGERDGGDFWFRTAAEIGALDPARFYVYEMRGQRRAIDLADLAALLDRHRRVVLELNPRQVAPFRRLPVVAGHPVVAVLLQPATTAEVAAVAAAAGVSPAAALTDIMLTKQVHRSLRQGKRLDAAELADLRVRAEHAWAEMNCTDGFDHLLVNHDAEGSEHWLFTPPLGDAGHAMSEVAAWLEAISGY